MEININEVKQKLSADLNGTSIGLKGVMQSLIILTEETKKQLEAKIADPNTPESEIPNLEKELQSIKNANIAALHKGISDIDSAMAQINVMLKMAFKIPNQ